MISPPAALHALLFASGEPIEKRQLAKLLEMTDEEFAIVLSTLSNSLKGSGVTVIETEDNVELRTTPDASFVVKKLRENELARDLGKSSLETLAVIAYHTGATRSDIDWVRGVNSSTSIRTLLMRGLIDGKEDEHDKRRIHYSLTIEALAHLGITHIDDLPRSSELRTITDSFVQEKDAKEPLSEGTTE